MALVSLCGPGVNQELDLSFTSFFFSALPLEYSSACSDSSSSCLSQDPRSIHRGDALTFIGMGKDGLLGQSTSD